MASRALLLFSFKRALCPKRKSSIYPVILHWFRLPCPCEHGRGAAHLPDCVQMLFWHNHSWAVMCVKCSCFNTGLQMCVRDLLIFTEQENRSLFIPIIFYHHLNIVLTIRFKTWDLTWNGMSLAVRLAKDLRHQEGFNEFVCFIFKFYSLTV